MAVSLHDVFPSDKENQLSLGGPILSPWDIHLHLTAVNGTISDKLQ